MRSASADFSVKALDVTEDAHLYDAIQGKSCSRTSSLKHVLHRAGVRLAHHFTRLAPVAFWKDRQDLTAPHRDHGFQRSQEWRWRRLRNCVCSSVFWSHQIYICVDFELTLRLWGVRAEVVCHHHNFSCQVVRDEQVANISTTTGVSAIGSVFSGRILFYLGFSSRLSAFANNMHTCEQHDDCSRLEVRSICWFGTEVQTISAISRTPSLLYLILALARNPSPMIHTFHDQGVWCPRLFAFGRWRQSRFEELLHYFLSWSSCSRRREKVNAFGTDGWVCTVLCAYVCLVEQERTLLVVIWARSEEHTCTIARQTAHQWRCRRMTWQMLDRYFSSPECIGVLLKHAWRQIHCCSASSRDTRGERLTESVATTPVSVQNNGTREDCTWELLRWRTEILRVRYGRCVETIGVRPGYTIATWGMLRWWVVRSVLPCFRSLVHPAHLRWLPASTDMKLLVTHKELQVNALQFVQLRHVIAILDQTIQRLRGIWRLGVICYDMPSLAVKWQSMCWSEHCPTRHCIPKEVAWVCEADWFHCHRATRHEVPSPLLQFWVRCFLCRRLMLCLVVAGWIGHILISILAKVFDEWAYCSSCLHTFNWRSAISKHFSISVTESPRYAAGGHKSRRSAHPSFMMTCHDDNETSQMRRDQWQVGIEQQGFKFNQNKCSWRLQGSGNDTMLTCWIMPIETFFMDGCTLLVGPGHILGFTLWPILQFMAVTARLFVTVRVLGRCLTIHGPLSRTVALGTIFDKRLQLQPFCFGINIKL